MNNAATYAEQHEFIDEIQSLLELAFDLQEKELADADFIKLIDLSDIYLYKLFEGETELEVDLAMKRRNKLNQFYKMVHFIGDKDRDVIAL